MSRQIHFVVMYDTESGEFEVDYDTQSVRFPEGYIYDTNTEEWSRVSDEELNDDDSEYCKSADALYDALRMIEWRNQ